MTMTMVIKTLVIVVILPLWFLLCIGHYSDAKNLYLIPDITTTTIDTYAIEASGNSTYARTVALQYLAEPVGVAIDGYTNTLFITGENQFGFELINAHTGRYLGYVTPETGNYAGIDIDEANRIIYVVRRNYGNIYAYDFDYTKINQIDPNNIVIGTGAVTIRPGFPKVAPGLAKATGIAFNDQTGILYISDSQSKMVRGYEDANWTEVMNYTPSITPAGITVDKTRGIIYTVCPDFITESGREGDTGKCVVGTTFDPGYTLLSKYVISTGVETTTDIGHGGTGIAVDEVTGYVYISGGCSNDTLSVWNPGTTPATLVYTTGIIGNPTGIAIPNELQGAGQILGVDRVHGLAVKKSNIWNQLKDAAAGDSLISGVGAFQLYLYDPNSSTFNRETGSITTGAKVQVTRVAPVGGTNQYCVKKIDIDPNSALISFGFESNMVSIETDPNNTDNIVIDWLSGSATIPGTNTAGDDLLPPGLSVVFDLYRITGIAIKSVSGTQTVQVRAFN